MPHATIKVFLCGLLLISLAGCATLAPIQRAERKEPLEGLKLDEIVDTRTGRTISRDALINDLSRAQIVYVGETHTNPEDHRVQEQILEELYARNRGVILAMEMFPREAQPVLDEYSKGLISEEEFMKKVDWDGIWGYPFALYSGLLTSAREKRLKIVGLNAPRDMVSKIAQSGLSSLTPAERGRVAADFHPDDPGHRQYVREQYDEHLKGSIKDFETFYEAQLAWEETMAETLAQQLTPPAEEKQVLVLIGKGHIADRVGLPLLTSKRVQNIYKTVAPMPINYPESLTDPDLADYVWVTDKWETPRPHRGRLGVMIHPAPSGEGLEVLEVAPDSPAEKAGILKGDILYMIDDIPIKTIGDLHKAFARETPVHRLGIRRGNREISLTVTISK